MREASLGRAGPPRCSAPPVPCAGVARAGPERERFMALDTLVAVEDAVLGAAGGRSVAEGGRFALFAVGVGVVARPFFSARPKSMRRYLPSVRLLRQYRKLPAQFHF